MPWALYRLILSMTVVVSVAVSRQLTPACSAALRHAQAEVGVLAGLGAAVLLTGDVDVFLPIHRGSARSTIKKLNYLARTTQAVNGSLQGIKSNSDGVRSNVWAQ